MCNDEHDENYAYENGDHDKYNENASKKDQKIRTI